MLKKERFVGFGILLLVGFMTLIACGSGKEISYYDSEGNGSSKDYYAEFSI